MFTTNHVAINNKVLVFMNWANLLIHSNSANSKQSSTICDRGRPKFRNIADKLDLNLLAIWLYFVCVYCFV